MQCSVCKELSPENSKYCCWCGRDLNQRPQTSGLAIASLFLGVLGILAVWIDVQDALSRVEFDGEFSPRADASLMYSPAIVAGILMGHLALRRIRADRTLLSGRALARTGQILGYTTL